MAKNCVWSWIVLAVLLDVPSVATAGSITYLLNYSDEIHLNNGATAAGLDLVKHQQQLVVRGQLPQTFENSVRGYANTTFALNRFDQDCTGFFVNQLDNGFEVAVGRVNETGHQRP